MVIVGCSTTNKIPPGLTKDMPETLPKLEGNTNIDILNWKIEADAQYKRCIDSRDALIELTK